MFVPARISLGSARILGRKAPNYLSNQISEEEDDFYNLLLQNVSDEDGNINGTQLQNVIFPLKNEYDVFISYSHNDENVAFALYSYLASKGLNVFLDSTVWHSSDKLLWKIDDKNSRTDYDAKLIDYTKSLYSSSHVHAMLSMAMLEAINRSELCIFLETNNSTTLKDGIEKHTLSPWLYEELSYFEKIRPQIPKRFKTGITKCFSEGPNIRIVDESLEYDISYKVNIKNLINLTPSDFRGHGKQMLNIIYRRKGIDVPLMDDTKYELFD